MLWGAHHLPTAWGTREVVGGSSYLHMVLEIALGFEQALAVVLALV